MPGAPDRDQLLPQLGREAPWLVPAQPVERSEAVRQRPEHVDDRRVARRSGRGPPVVYNIRRCSTPPAWRRTRWRGGPPSPRPRSRSNTSTAARLTYAELDRRARAWAGALTAVGVAPGDHVATMLPNTVRRPPHAARARVVARGRGAAQRRVHRPHARVLARRTPTSPRSSSRPSSLDAVRRRRGRRPGTGRIIVLDDATRAAFDAAAGTDRAGRTAVPRRALADVHLGHDRPVEGGASRRGRSCTSSGRGSRRHARRRATACTARCRCSTTPGVRRSTTRWCAAAGS